MQLSKIKSSNPFKLITTWVQRTSNRDVLKNLSDQMLSDIGLTRTEIRKEIIKPFWKE